MKTMYTIFMTIHVTLCVLIIVSILLQSSKGGGFGGIFGSSGEVIFSTPSGSSFIRKLTAGFAIAFGVTSLSLTIMSRRSMYKSAVLEEIRKLPPAPTPTGEPAPTPQR
ncbi:MAG: preprotein translocase subunit SecG [Elusimicrobia bacterium]|nr:preprotein translocase subunit SecG [Elusimicrobiota bacterium]